MSNLMGRIRPESISAYTFAVFCVAVAALARWSIGLFFVGVVPFATFFPATLIAALVGGVGPGTFAAIIGGAIGWWAFIEPTMAWFPLTAGQTVSICAYCATSLVLVWAANHYRSLTKRLQQEEKFRQLAVEELAHRLKNKVATIQSIVTLRLRDNPEARDEIVSCLTSLRATDDLILAAQGKGANFGDILAAELEPYDASRLSVEGPQVLLPPKIALMLALLVHELTTNAAKYGALSVSSGEISVKWSYAEPVLEIVWRESGGPTVSPPDRRGFGTRLFLRALDQFNGKVEATFAPTGLVCELRIPLTDTPANIVPASSHPPELAAQSGT